MVESMSKCKTIQTIKGIKTLASRKFTVGVRSFDGHLKLELKNILKLVPICCCLSFYVKSCLSLRTADHHHQA